MKSTYTSDELFHFVGRRVPDDHEANYQTLLKVLRKGSVSHPPHGRDWGIVSHKIDFTKRLIAGEFLVSTITCYCDIPVDHLPLHVKKYGKFGLSFTREYLIRYGRVRYRTSRTANLMLEMRLAGDSCCPTLRQFSKHFITMS